MVPFTKIPLQKFPSQLQSICTGDHSDIFSFYLTGFRDTWLFFLQQPWSKFKVTVILLNSFNWEYFLSKDPFSQWIKSSRNTVYRKKLLLLNGLKVLKTHILIQCYGVCWHSSSIIFCHITIIYYSTFYKLWGSQL